MTKLELKCLENIKSLLEETKKYNTVIYPSSLESYNHERHFEQNSNKDMKISESIIWIEIIIKNDTIYL